MYKNVNGAAIEMTPEEVAAVTAFQVACASASATTSISKRQGRAQLKVESLLAPVQSYINSLPEDDLSRMAYEDASEWVRTDPNVLAMMQMLGKSDADADAFFLKASAL